MRKATPVPLDQVPPVPAHIPGQPSGTSGDVVFEDGIHRWRYDKNGTLLYYIRYSDKRDRQEAMYERRRR